MFSLRVQIDEDNCFCVMHLLRACCDHECYNFGIVANFVCNMGVYYFEIYYTFLVSVMSIWIFEKNDSLCSIQFNSIQCIHPNTHT